MDNKKLLKCPGCSRRCPMGWERCKYGKKHFAGLAQAKQSEQKKPEQKKWEKYVTSGSDAWKLLDTSRSVKKALKHGADENQLFSALDRQERAQLDSILPKLGSAAPAKGSAKQTD